MINEVRNAVLAFLNKNNYGYISPQDFNLYAKQAQLDIFEDLFYQYNYQINKENARQSGTGYADIKKGIEEDIDIFSQDVILLNTAGDLYTTVNSSNAFALPTDYYFINKVYYRPYYTIYPGSNTNPPTAYRLIIAAGLSYDFAAVRQGDFVINTVTKNTAFVVGKVSNTELALSADIFPAAPADFVIFSNQYVTEIERVHQKRVNQLLSSTLTTPTREFPIYSVDGNNINIYPMSIATKEFYGTQPANYNYVFCQYIRYPLDPKWTYSLITGGEPSFDQSQTDYQDFELPEDSFADLVIRILKYGGVEIRELDVVEWGEKQEILNNQTEA